MNYYIQGDAAKAEQIKAAFEKLGIDVLDFGFADKTVVYCSIGGACVQSLPYSINLMHILYSHPGYKELELPVQTNFKVGDWIVQNDNGTVSQITKTINGKDEDGEYRAYEHTNGYFAACFENEYHLWAIADAKDGDVLAYQDEIFIARIARGLSVNVAIDYDCCYDGNSFILDSFYSLTQEELKRVYPATKEQRDLLFAKMREAGYEWDADKKEIRKIQPHYDIANFHAGIPVLVRDYDNSRWSYVQFSHYVGECRMKFNACGIPYIQCIPYNDDTKHLLGTTDMCGEEYINW